MYLALTPSKHNVNDTSISSKALDGVSLNVALKPLTKEFTREILSEDLSQDSLKAVPTHGEVSVIHGDQTRTPTPAHSEVSVTHSDDTKVEKPTQVPIPNNSMLAETILSPTTERDIIDPVEPPGRNSNQDTVATTPISVPIEDPPVLVEELLLPATRLKRQLDTTKELIVCPGVYDGFSARIALQVGFDALYMVSQILHSLSLQMLIPTRPVLEPPHHVSANLISVSPNSPTCVLKPT